MWSESTGGFSRRHLHQHQLHPNHLPPPPLAGPSLDRHPAHRSLARIGHLQVELALASDPGSLPPIDQRYFDMTKQVLDSITPKLQD